MCSNSTACKVKNKLFTGPCRRPCAFPIVIQYFRALPLTVFPRLLRRRRYLPRRQCNASLVVSSNDALQFVKVVAVVMLFAFRLFELEVCAEHRLLFHHKLANDGLRRPSDAAAVYKSPSDFGMHLVLDSAIVCYRSRSSITDMNSKFDIIVANETRFANG